MSNEEKTQLDKDFEAAEAKAKEANASRSGVGTRMFVGKTRGKATQVISYEQFDTNLPDTLPKDMKQFMEITGKSDQPTLLGYLIEGYNAELYQAASDPLAEFVEDSWPADAKTQFRIVVRNYARGAGVSLESAVELIKPGFAKQFSAK